MPNVGIVVKGSYINKSTNEVVKTIDMYIKTISFRNKFTISVNKHKYLDGVINSNIAAGKEDYPDYNIWFDIFTGKNKDSIIVGSVKNRIGKDTGTPYKQCSIFDPFISKESIYFKLYGVDEDKKIDVNHIYNVVAYPYTENSDSESAKSYNTSQPSYGEPQATYAKADGSTIPEHRENIPAPIDIDEDEIPF